MNSTVATSAMPMGMPGWPDLAFSTASMASARMALAMSLCATARSWLIFATGSPCPPPLLAHSGLVLREHAVAARAVYRAAAIAQDVPQV